MFTELRERIRQQQINENTAVLNVDTTIATGDVESVRYQAAMLVRVFAVSQVYRKILLAFPGLKHEVLKHEQISIN